MNYVKEFENWNVIKQSLQTREGAAWCHEQEIWILHLGVNLGVGLDGKGDRFTRPVLILRKFNHRQFVGIPLTTREKPATIGFLLQGISFLKPKSWLNISQIRVFDTKRLYRKLGKLPDPIFTDIKNISAQVFTRASGA